MAVSRNVPIEVAKNVYREVKLIFSDKPDLSEADIRMVVKEFGSSPDTLFEKLPDFNMSDLKNGIVFFVFSPTELNNYEARTYYYEIHVDLPGEEAYVPLIGDLMLYNTHTT